MRNIFALVLFFCMSAYAEKEEFLFVEEVGGPYTDSWSATESPYTKKEKVKLFTISRNGKSGDLIFSAIYDCAADKLVVDSGIAYGHMIESPIDLSSEEKIKISKKIKKLFCEIKK